MIRERSETKNHSEIVEMLFRRGVASIRPLMRAFGLRQGHRDALQSQRSSIPEGDAFTVTSNTVSV
jgi:hypothetical protein